MSSRPLIAPKPEKPLINGGDMSGDITGPPTIIQMLPGISYDLSWTGTPTGTFEVQVSNSYNKGGDGTPAVSGNWTSIPSSSFTGTYPVPSGSASTGFLDVIGTEAYAVRLIYKSTSGSGSLTVIPCAKVL